MPGSSDNNCKARHQGGNEMCCNQCGLVWDVSDPEPPQCRNEEPRSLKLQRGKKVIKKLHDVIDKR